MFSRSVLALVASSALVSTLGCAEAKKKEGEADAEAPKKAAKSAAPAASGVPGASGAGDRSGKDLANAMPLEKGKPAVFGLKCGDKRFVGPFRFHADKESLKVKYLLTSAAGAQVCGGGEWQSDKGEFIAVAGLGCTEGTAKAEGENAIEYDPKSGGVDKNPVFLSLSLGEAMCADAQVTLSLP